MTFSSSVLQKQVSKNNFENVKLIVFVESEMSLLALLCANEKTVFVLHPIFDAFVRLKWKRCSFFFYFYLIYSFLYTFLITCHALEQFSFVKQYLPNNCFAPVLVVLLPIICIERILTLVLKTIVVVEYIQKYGSKGFYKDSIYCYLIAIYKALWTIAWNSSHPIFLGILLFLDLDEFHSRNLTALLIFLSAVLNLTVLSEIPAFGIHLMMITRVLISASRFFLTFGVVFMSFGFIFHILLYNVESFSSLGDSFLKLFAMMMGELDVYNSFTKNEEAGVLAKIFFLVFLIFMALIFMNLLLGIAVSDIHELERMSKTQTVIIRCFNIEYIERIAMLFK